MDRASPTRKLDVNGLIGLQRTDAPGTCDAATAGSIYFDDSLDKPCYCNGAAWKSFDEVGTCL